MSSEVHKKQKPKRTKSTLPADGPTASRVHAQITSTGIPSVRLPPVEPDKNTDDTEVEPAPGPIPSISDMKTETKESKGKGSFATHSFTLKKSK